MGVRMVYERDLKGVRMTAVLCELWSQPFQFWMDELRGENVWYSWEDYSFILRFHALYTGLITFSQLN